MHGLKWAEYSFAPSIPPMTPWESAVPGREAVLRTSSRREFHDYVNPTTGKDVGCLPPGRATHLYPTIFVRDRSSLAPAGIVEFDHHIRQIFTDGRGHSQRTRIHLMGNSIGRYEGDTLVDRHGRLDGQNMDRSRRTSPFRPVARHRRIRRLSPSIGNQSSRSIDPKA